MLSLQTRVRLSEPHVIYTLHYLLSPTLHVAVGDMYILLLCRHCYSTASHLHLWEAIETVDSKLSGYIERKTETVDTYVHKYICTYVQTCTCTPCTL